LSSNSDATREALQTFKTLLQNKELSIDSEIFKEVVKFLRRPGIQSLHSQEKAELQGYVCTAFSLSWNQLGEYLGSGRISLPESLAPASDPNSALRLEQELRSLLPTGGFLDQYAEYTLTSEAPLAYHIFCALVVIGCVSGRQVWFNMGHYRLYPPLGVFLLGPSGLRKTSASNIALKLLQKINLAKVYPEKFTPEAVTLNIAQDGCGLLYGPEMSATLGKQKYLEGLIPLLTRVQDCPDEMLTDTISRGKVLLKDVAISLLMCSTPDWFVSNTPADTFGGGFIARNIMVMQNDSPREEDVPTPPPESLRNELLLRLLQINKNLRGELRFTPDARELHRQWYHSHREKTKHPEHPLLATYYQRKPDHVKRIAMCIHMVERYNLLLDRDSLSYAIGLLDWTERFIPPMLTSMFRNQMGEAHEFVLSALRSYGPVVPHAVLLRKVQHRMGAGTLRSIVNSLKESELVQEVRNNLQHVYIVLSKNNK